MVLQQKLEMLDSLLEIEIAYSMLKTKSDAEGDVHPLDAHYAKLNTNIEILDKKTDEFKLLQQYVRNTHAATHTQYDLEVLEVCFMTMSIMMVCVVMWCCQVGEYLHGRGKIHFKIFHSCALIRLMGLSSHDHIFSRFCDYVFQTSKIFLKKYSFCCLLQSRRIHALLTAFIRLWYVN